jgi:tRNA pseudouridine38-40 synthase
MRNIRLTIRYDGTNYSGWQYQDNARTVQHVIARTLKGIVGRKVNLIGSGRTDSGVHAEAQIANFKTHSTLPLKRIQAALNSRLPKDIVITDIRHVPLRFDSRHDAKSKLYRYTIVNGNFIDPFLRHFAAKYFYRLDVKPMAKAAKRLIGRHDFRAFQAKDGQEKESIRTIRRINVAKKANMIYIYIEADGFLYNMARNIVGTLIEVGRGKITAESVSGILRCKDRRLCGPTAPAKGLTLVRVRY